MSRHRLTLAGDFSAFDAAVAELSAFLESPLKLPAKLRQRLVRLAEAPEKFFRLDVDDAPATTGELLVRAQPTQRLAVLLAACRARNGKAGTFGNGHDDSPSLAIVPPATIARAREGGKPRSRRAARRCAP
jgi:hypothetical protein